MGLLVLLLSFNFNLGNAFANTSGNTDFSKEELKEQQILFEKILEETPSGVYVDEEDQILSTLATSNNYTAKSGDILYTPNTQCINNTDICKNISGHAGLVHPSTLHVIHIAGPGQNQKLFL
ncbi:hypothetical protein [Sporosarcina aquimarina]|uniref:hypothetical protein n=1 Tax=Sporosarcina aquimarina TaxID=114975 RepID=UPI00295EC035|nr:hypothetical protein [Sporosarcina aquimarina]